MAKNCALYVSKNCAVLLAEKCVLYLTIYTCINGAAVAEEKADAGIFNARGCGDYRIRNEVFQLVQARHCCFCYSAKCWPACDRYRKLKISEH